MSNKLIPYSSGMGHMEVISFIVRARAIVKREYTGMCLLTTQERSRT